MTPPLPHAHALLAALVAASAVACATVGPRPDPDAPSLEAFHASLLADLPDEDNPVRHAHLERLALAARLDEAFGSPELAWGRWLAAGESPALRPWALSRLAGLLDRVPLLPARPAAPTPPRTPDPSATLAHLAAWLPDSAPLITELAWRAGLDVPVAIRDALPPPLRYRPSPRLLPWPGPVESTPGLGWTPLCERRSIPLDETSAACAWRETSDGHLSTGHEGPGLYAFELELPPGRHRFWLRSDAAVAVFVVSPDPDLPPRQALTHPALTQLLPTALALDLTVAPGERVELLVADRASPARLALSRTALGPTPPLPLPLATLDPTALLAALDLAIADADAETLSRLEAELEDRLADPPHRWAPHRALTPLWHLALAAIHLGDASRPPERARPNADAHLEAALAEAPGLLEAALHRAALLVDDSPQAAIDLLAPWLLQDAPPSVSAQDTRRRPDPLLAHIYVRALSQAGEHRDAHALAAALLDRLPTSCAALDLWLDVGFLELSHRPEAIASRGPHASSSSPPRGLCLAARLRQIEVLRQSSQLTDAERLLAPLLGPSGLSPGPDRARAHLASAQLRLARGDAQGAARDARLARLHGEDPTLCDELAARADTLAALGTRLTSRDLAHARRPDHLPLTPVGPLLARLPRRPPPDRAPGDPTLGGTTTLLRDHHVHVHADGSLTIRHHTLVRPLDKKAVESLGEVAIPEGAELLVARTWKVPGRGSPYPLEPEDILEKSTVSLPDLAIGDVGEWAWVQTLPPDPRIAPDWALAPFFFDSTDGPVERARFVLTTHPEARPPRFFLEPHTASRLGPPDRRPPPAQPPPPRTGAKARAPRPPSPSPTWTFALEGVPQAHPEPFDPRPDSRRLAISAHSVSDPTRFHLAQRAELLHAIRPSPATRALIEEALAGHAEGPPLDRLRLVYDHLRRVIEEPPEAEVFGPSASSATYIAHRRRGTRALLLLSACQTLGLGCELALARPLWQGDPPLHFDPQSHSYPLVWLPRSNTWLDPSGRFNPWDTLPPALTGVPAISLPRNAPPRALSTPPLTFDGPGRAGRRLAAIDITLETPERWTARGRDELDGAFGASWRHVLAPLRPEHRDRILASVVQQSLPGATVSDMTIEHLEDDDRPLLIRWRAAGVTQPAGGRMRSVHLALHPEAIARSTVVMNRRETPLLVNLAVALELRVSVTAPPGHGFPTVPRDVLLEYGPMRLERRSSFSEDARSVLLDKTFVLRPAILAPDEYTPWRDAAQAVDRADLVALTFGPGSSELPASARPPDSPPGASPPTPAPPTTP